MVYDRNDRFSYFFCLNIRLYRTACDTLKIVVFFCMVQCIRVAERRQGRSGLASNATVTVRLVPCDQIYMNLKASDESLRNILTQSH